MLKKILHKNFDTFGMKILFGTYFLNVRWIELVFFNIRIDRKLKID